MAQHISVRVPWKDMYDHKVHSAADHIVSISQPWLRSIALIQAYKLEGQIAIYPRIIVETEIAEIIKSIMKPEKGKLLCEDFDGIYFVDSFGINQKKQGLYLIDQFINDNTIRLRNSQKDLKNKFFINY